MTDVMRLGRNPGGEGRIRSSQVTIHRGVARIVATAAKPYDPNASAEVQTRQALALLDERLALAGTDKSRVLIAQVLISDMRHFAGLNAAWDEWVDQDNPPCRFCSEARLGHPDLKVEIIVEAATEMGAAP